MNVTRLLFLLFIALAILTASFVSCGDDDDDDDAAADDDEDDDDDDDTADDDDDATDDDDDYSGPTWEGNEKIFVDTPDGMVPVNLAGLPMFMWTDPEDSMQKQAMYIQTVIDEAVDMITSSEIDPTLYNYNFEAGDGYNVWREKLHGSWEGLPTYSNTADGWIIQYEEEGGGKFLDIQLVWDDSLEFPNYMKVRKMNGGIFYFMDKVNFDQDATITVDFMTKGVKGAVSLNGLPAYYDDEGELSVLLAQIVDKAALTEFDPDTYDYKFDLISGDIAGYSILHDGVGDVMNLLPSWSTATNKDIHHGWVKMTYDEGLKAFWDTDTGFGTEYEVTFMDGGRIDVYTPTK